MVIPLVVQFLEMDGKCSTFPRTNSAAQPLFTKQTGNWKPGTLLHKETEQEACFAVKVRFEETLGKDSEEKKLS